jgi:hypothetical protein
VLGGRDLSNPVSPAVDRYQPGPQQRGTWTVWRAAWCGALGVLGSTELMDGGCRTIRLRDCEAAVLLCSKNLMGVAGVGDVEAAVLSCCAEQVCGAAQEYAIAKLDDTELKKAFIRVKKPKEQMTESDRSRSRERERRRGRKSRSAHPPPPSQTRAQRCAF